MAMISAPYLTTRQPIAVGSETTYARTRCEGGAHNARAAAHVISLIQREFEPFYGNLLRLERRVEENENG
jgi:hypothetical protein